MRIRYSFSSRRTRQIEAGNQHRVAYPKLALEVIRISDIILEILDARFLAETRNLELEEMIKQEGKKLIYVLNKTDLVNVEDVKASDVFRELRPSVFISCKEKKGITSLRRVIKIEVKRLKLEKTTGMKRAQVGVIGYPNTGKSSLLNLLVGRGSAGTAAQAGFTRGIQKVRMSKGIMIIDTPGVIPGKEYAPSSQSQTALKKQAKIGVVTHDQARNPEFVIASLMRQYSKAIEKFYAIDAQGDPEILMEELGKRRKYLKKGGLIDTARTARAILKDWQEGNIKK